MMIPRGGQQASGCTMYTTACSSFRLFETLFPNYHAVTTLSCSLFLHFHPSFLLQGLAAFVRQAFSWFSLLVSFPVPLLPPSLRTHVHYFLIIARIGRVPIQPSRLAWQSKSGSSAIGVEE